VQLNDFYMVNLTGNPLETCLAATRLILSGFFDRHPALDVVLVHAGGLMPYQVGRLDHGFRVRPETSARIAMPPSTYLRRFCYDTITHASLPLRFLIDLAGFDRVMLGTDIPFDMADERFATYLEEVDLDAQILDAITGGNAVSLYGLDDQRRPGALGPGAT
jgi:aminocarboxymuconate-semialdehyde decarboxylase